MNKQTDRQCKTDCQSSVSQTDTPTQAAQQSSNQHSAKQPRAALGTAPGAGVSMPGKQRTTLKQAKAETNKDASTCAHTRAITQTLKRVVHAATRQLGAQVAPGPEPPLSINKANAQTTGQANKQASKNVHMSQPNDSTQPNNHKQTSTHTCKHTHKHATTNTSQTTKQQTSKQASKEASE